MSILQNVRLSERSEVFSLKPLTDFILKIDQLKTNSQSYKRYGPSKNYCSGLGGDHVDSLEEDEKIARSKKLNNLVISHLEFSSPYNFLVVLMLHGTNFQCKYSYSLNSIQKLNSLNTVRNVPYYANGLSTFCLKQSKNLRTLDKKQCAYKGELRQNDVRKFIVQDQIL